MQRNEIIKVQNGSTDKVRVQKVLKSHNIDYKCNKGAFGSIYIRFEANKETMKLIEKELNLLIENVYYTFKELGD